MPSTNLARDAARRQLSFGSFWNGIKLSKTADLQRTRQADPVAPSRPPARPERLLPGDGAVEARSFSKG
jgi:hypothetical protein